MDLEDSPPNFRIYSGGAETGQYFLYVRTIRKKVTVQNSSATRDLMLIHYSAEQISLSELLPKKI